MHDISLISKEQLESLLSDEELKEKDKEKNIVLFINKYTCGMKDSVLRLQNIY